MSAADPLLRPADAGWEAVNETDLGNVYGLDAASSPADAPASPDMDLPGSSALPASGGEFADANPEHEMDDELRPESSVGARMSLAAAGALQSVSDMLWRRPGLASRPASTADEQLVAAAGPGSAATQAHQL